LEVNEPQNENGIDEEDNFSDSESEIEIGHNKECSALDDEYGEVRNNIALEANDVLYVWKWFFYFMLSINVEGHLNLVAFLVEKKHITVLLNYLRLLKRR